MAVVPNLEETRSKVLERLLIEDESMLRLDEVEVTDVIRDALDQFNVVAPLLQVHQEAGDGTKKRIVLNTSISGWVKSISQVSEVSWVLNPDLDNEVITALRRENWIQSVSASGDEVLTMTQACPSGSTIRVTWTTYAVIEDLDSAVATTIEERYTEAFYLYAVHAGAMAVSRKASRLKQASFGADITSFDEVYQRWVDIARRVKKEAQGRLGSIRGSVTGAGASANWATRTRFGGGTRISHG